MTITADQVKQLREQTGAGMMECKKALQEAAGDLEKAVDWLRKSGIAKAGKREGRAASEGLVDAYIHPGNRVGVLIEVNCETDFVARTPEFADLVRNLAMQVAAAGAEFVRREEVPTARVEREREIYAAQLREQGKAEKLIPQIVDGKLNRFFADICLLEQTYIRDDQRTIGELVTGFASKTVENIQVRRFTRFKLGQE
jgi:elongation factor Ts